MRLSACSEGRGSDADRESINRKKGLRGEKEQLPDSRFRRGSGSYTRGKVGTTTEKISDPTLGPLDPDRAWVDPTRLCLPPFRSLSTVLPAVTRVLHGNSPDPFRSRPKSD